MENATKALTFAGGILITMIVISIFYFSFKQSTETIGGVQEDTTQKELKDFNASFEAYDKKVMYGIDIVTVINKAIDNNKKYKVEYLDRPKDTDYVDYYVNVVFTYEGKTYSLKDMYTYANTSQKQEFMKFLDNLKKDEVDIKLENPSGGKEIDESTRGFKIKPFKCKKINYNKKEDIQELSAIGRVRELIFEEINN